MGAVTVSENGVAKGTTSNVDFIDGDNTTFDVVKDLITGKIKVKVNASGGNSVVLPTALLLNGLEEVSSSITADNTYVGKLICIETDGVIVTMDSASNFNVGDNIGFTSDKHTDLSYVVDEDGNEFYLGSESDSGEIFIMTVINTIDGHKWIPVSSAFVTDYNDGKHKTMFRWILDNSGGGGSPAGSDNQIQINQSGSFFADSTFQKSDTDFNVGLDHTTQSAVTFTGSGLDDLEFTGTSSSFPTTLTVTITEVNVDYFGADSITGEYTFGETITGGTSGTTAEFLGQNNGQIAYRNMVGSEFTFGETITGGTSGVTATRLGAGFGLVDTYSFTDGVTTYYQVASSGAGRSSLQGVTVGFTADTGHTLSDSWTWTYSNVNQNVLDFSNNDYNFKSTFGTDTFGYQISDNLLGAGISGSVNTWTTTGGDLGISGFYTGEDGFGNNTLIQWADGYVSGNTISKGYIGFFTSNGSDQFEYQTTINSFILRNSISNIDYGISQSAGVVSIGQITGPGNGTKITIDDVNEHITISNLPAYDDDAAAGAGGLIAGMVYMTTGSGSAPLNVSGILMIKQ